MPEIGEGSIFDVAARAAEAAAAAAERDRSALDGQTDTDYTPWLERRGVRLGKIGENLVDQVKAIRAKAQKEIDAGRADLQGRIQDARRLLPSEAAEAAALLPFVERELADLDAAGIVQAFQGAGSSKVRRWLIADLGRRRLRAEAAAELVDFDQAAAAKKEAARIAAAELDLATSGWDARLQAADKGWREMEAELDRLTTRYSFDAFMFGR